MVVVVEEKQTGISETTRLYSRLHIYIRTHVHYQTLQVRRSHNGIMELQWELWNSCGYVFLSGGGQTARQVQWKQWLWHIAAVLLTCSLSHVLVLVNSNAAWLLCQSFIWLLLRRIGRHVWQRTSNKKQTGGKVLHPNGVKEYNGPQQHFCQDEFWN